LDGRKNNGSKKGENRGGGRKPKSEEIRLIEQLTPYDDIALKALINGVKSQEVQFVKLFYAYRYGMPKQVVESLGEGNKLTIEIVRTKGQTGTT
jgi:hypothetical protein